MQHSKGPVKLSKRGFSSCTLGKRKQEHFSFQTPGLLSTAERLLVSARLRGSASGRSSYHALGVWNSHPTEELVGAEDLLVPGNKIPFDKE